MVEENVPIEFQEETDRPFQVKKFQKVEAKMSKFMSQKRRYKCRVR